MLSLGLSICSPAVWANGPFVPSNAETATLITALTGTYPKSLKQAWDDAIGALKTSGAWDDFDVLYPIGAIPGTASENAADSRLNWKSPSTFSLVAVNTPTHGSGYWQGDGSASRLRTQYTPATHGAAFLQDDASIWGWSLTDSDSASYDIGSASSAPAASINFSNAAGNMQGIINRGTSSLVTAVAASTGSYCAQVRGSADNRNWRNGVEIGTGITATTGRPAQEQWICGGNATMFSARRQCLGAWGASQSGRELSIHQTFETLFTAAGTI
jgi:hypothetical protein